MSLTRRNLLLLAAAVGITAGPAVAHAADVLNVGSYPNNPPFEYKNESGTFEGFEVDIVNEVSKVADITKVIEEGVPGTAMLSFKAQLTPEEIDGLARYVRSFDKSLKPEKPAKKK